MDEAQVYEEERLAAAEQLSDRLTVTRAVVLEALRDGFKREYAAARSLNLGRPVRLAGDSAWIWDKAAEIALERWLAEHDEEVQRRQRLMAIELTPTQERTLRAIEAGGDVRAWPATLAVLIERGLLRGHQFTTIAVTGDGRAWLDLHQEGDRG